KQKNDEKLNIVFEEQVVFESENNEISRQWDNEMNSHWNDTPQEDKKSWNDDRPTYMVDSEEFEEFEEGNSSNCLNNHTVEENRSTDSSQNTLIETSILGGLLLLRIKIFILKLRLANGDYTTMMNPFEILFSQSTINSSFRNGGNIEETINDLVNGDVKVEDFPYIQVCIIDDLIFSSDNRRLYMFQEAIRRGLKVDKIPVRVQRSTDLNIK
ncbi:4511_t:CDS:2, partial [Racocetra persica]